MELIQIGNFQVKAGSKLKSTLSVINNLNIQTLSEATQEEELNSILLIQKVEKFERYSKFILTDLENDITLVCVDMTLNFERFKPNQIILIHQAKVIEYTTNKLLFVQKASQIILLANSFNTKKCYNTECDRYISNKKIYCPWHFYEYMKHNDLINRVDLDQCSLTVLQQKPRINYSENIIINIDEYIQQKKTFQLNQQQSMQGKRQPIKQQTDRSMKNVPDRPQKVGKVKYVTYKLQPSNDLYDFKAILLEELGGSKMKQNKNQADEEEHVSKKARKEDYVSFQAVEAYFCETCRKFTQNVNLICQSSGHHIVQKQIKQLSLICKYCKSVTQTLSNKYAQMPCHKCKKYGFQYDD